MHFEIPDNNTTQIISSLAIVASLALCKSHKNDEKKLV